MKNAIKVFCNIAVFSIVSVILSNCFSSWEGDLATITLYTGGTGNGRYIAPLGEIEDKLEYTVELKGPSNITLYGSGKTKITGQVSPGSYDITVEAFLNERLYAKGFTTGEAKAGKDNQITVKMEQIEWHYEIGDTGPAGGIIFYVNTAGFIFYTSADDTTGIICYYLEAAPASTETITFAWWSYESGFPQPDINTDDGVGYGRWNTEKIIAKYLYCLANPGSYTFYGNYLAAKYCNDFDHEEYNDWFLPSLEELKLMHEYLYTGKLGGFTNGIYWSSSLADDVSSNSSAKAMQFGDSEDNDDGVSIDYVYSKEGITRPIRAF